MIADPTPRGLVHAGRAGEPGRRDTDWSMSQQNVEVIIQALEAYRAGGFAAGDGEIVPCRL